MPVKSSILISIFLLSAFGLAVGADSQSTPPSSPLRPLSQCLIPNQVENWGVIDDRRLVVETLGERFYDIQLASDCRDLQRRTRISFREGASLAEVTPTLTKSRAQAGKRICGDLGDAIVPLRGAGDIAPSCGIALIRRIDRNTFESVFSTSAKAGNALLDSAVTLPTPPVLVYTN